MEWVECKDRLPELKDALVLVYFKSTGSIETVNIKEYFKDITAGWDKDRNQLYTKWYLIKQVTHWMDLPNPPDGRSEC